jgi:glutathione S-transferase
MPDTYIVYGGPYTRTGLVLMVLDSAALPYEQVDVDTVAHEHRRASYLTINPAGYVPALVTPSGEVLHEAPAIMLYLCERHGLTDLAPPPGDPSRGAFLTGMFFCASDIQPELKRYFFPQRFAPSGTSQEGIQSLAFAALRNRFGVIEEQLRNAGPYYLGERFSLVDLTLTFWATTCHPLQRMYDGYPNLETFCARIKREHDDYGHIAAHEQASLDFWNNKLQSAEAKQRRK